MARKSPLLPALICWSWLPWGEAGADGGLGLLLDHTPGPAHPGCQPELGLQRLSFLSEDRVLSPALRSPTPVSSLAAAGSGPREWCPSAIREGSLLIMHTWGLVFASLRHMGRGLRREGRTQATGSAPWAGAKSPWEVPQPCEQSRSLTR